MKKQKDNIWDIIPKTTITRLPKKGSYKETGLKYEQFHSYHRLLKKKKNLFPKSYLEFHGLK